MTDQERIAEVRLRIGEQADVTAGFDSAITDGLILAYLSDAEDAILNRLYSLRRPDDAILPARYDIYQCKLAARYVLRRGAEGENIHDENGIVRHYASVDDSDILNEIVPYAVVM